MNRRLRLAASIVSVVVAMGIAQGSANAVVSSTERPTEIAGSAAFPYGCPYFSFCLYQGLDFTGSKTVLYWCGVYYYLPSPGQSYVNNNAPGTVAIFRDARGNELKRSVPPDSGLVPPGTASVQPC